MVKWIYNEPGAAHKRGIALAMFVVWLGIVSYLAWMHQFYRDEVKALSIALKGDSAFAMLKELRWEGHPGVWYLLLRAAHALFPRPEVLLLVSIAVAAGAMLILLLRSPFSLLMLALLLFTRFSMYEYSVMPRNYGISMLLLFLFAALYERHHKKDCYLGVLLLVLVNCNVHSVLLAGGLLLFWAVDVLDGEPDRLRSIQIFLCNAVLAAVGVVGCFITIFPTLNDSAGIDDKTVTFKTLIEGIFLPSLQFAESCVLPGAAKFPWLLPAPGKPVSILLSLVLFGSTLGLIRRKSAFIAALTTLVGFSLFFVVFHQGYYRHQALWIVFLVCMYWLAAPGNAQKEPAFPTRLKPFIGLLSTAGTLLFVLVLVLSRYNSHRLMGILRDPAAALHSRNNNLNSMLAGHSDLEQAVIISVPDYIVETVPYYVSNPTYLMREQRYGDVVHFTRKAQLDLSLGDVLTNARRLRQETGKPVLLLLADDIDPSLLGHVYREGYNWKFVITPEQAHDFQLSTHLIGRHISQEGTDEGYYAYVIDK